MKRFALFTAAAAMTCSALAADHVFEVGDEPSCTHGDLQVAVNDAINLSPDSVELRVTRGTEIANPPLLIHGGRIDLTGGWFSCGSTSRSGTTGLFGDADSRAISIQGRVVDGESERAEVVLERMLVSGGQSVQGGGIQVRQASRLELVESEVVGNQAEFAGGGVAIVDGSILVTQNSRISGNVLRTAATDPRGGGVLCADNASIILLGGTEISNNVSQTDSPQRLSTGGGAHFGSSCSVSIEGSVTIAQNRAVRGGGLFFADGSFGALLRVGNSFPEFDGNQISSFGFVGLFPSGGAMYLARDATIRFDRFRATGNGSVAIGEGSSGGVFTLEAGARLDQVVSASQQALSNDCPDGATCMLIADNRADVAPVGFTAANTSVELDRALITGHQVIGGTLINAGDASEIVLTNSIVVGNAVEGFLDSNAPGNVVMDFAHNTFADNPGLNFVVRPFGTGNRIRFANNLVDGDVALNIADADADDAFAFEQWICHVGKISSDRPFDRQVLVGDPGFVDRVGLDYSLRADSPVIDVCPHVGLPDIAGLEFDFDGDERPFDHAAVADTEFLADGGADEATQAAEINSVTVNVNGPGRVSGMDQAIDCPGNCFHEFPSTFDVSLVAGPDPGFETIWGGDCDGATGDRCEFTMLDDRVIEVEFVVSDSLFSNGFEAR